MYSYKGKKYGFKCCALLKIFKVEENKPKANSAAKKKWCRCKSTEMPEEDKKKERRHEMRRGKAVAIDWSLLMYQDKLECQERN